MQFDKNYSKNKRVQFFCHTVRSLDWLQLKQGTWRSPWNSNPVRF